MSAETTKIYEPDEFLEKSNQLDQLFAELDMPIEHLGEAVVRQHLHVVENDSRPIKSHQQQAAEYFGKSVFPSSIR